jgi:hypothetical protein
MNSGLTNREKQSLKLAVLQAGDMMAEGLVGDDPGVGLMGVFEHRPELWKSNRPVYQFRGLQKREIYLFYSDLKKKWWIANGDALRESPEKVGGFVTMCRASSTEPMTPDLLKQSGEFWRVAPGDGQWYKTAKL